MTARETTFQILLWVSATGLAVWTGGTFYQMVVVVPIWSHSPPESVTAFFETTRYNETIWNFFGPPFMAARLLPLVGALIAGWHFRSHRRWLLLAVACMAFGLIFTLFYIYPINSVLFTNAGRGLEPEAVRDLANSWILADRIRFAIGSIAFLSVLRAFSLPLRSD